MFNIGDKVRIKEGTVTPVKFENNIGHIQGVTPEEVTVVNRFSLYGYRIEDLYRFERTYDSGFFDTFSHEDLELVEDEEVEEMSMDDILLYNINTPNSKVEFIKSIDLEGKDNDLVKSPNHYIGELGLEVEEVLRNFIPRYEDAYVAHRIASAIEYLLRSPLKNGTQDLEKARYNIGQALEHIGNKDNE